MNKETNIDIDAIKFPTDDLNRIQGLHLMPCPLSQLNISKLVELLAEIPLESLSHNEDSIHQVQVGRVMIDKQYPTKVYHKADAILEILNPMLKLVENHEELQIRRCQINKLGKECFVGHHYDTDANPDYKLVIILALSEDYQGGEYEITIDSCISTFRLPKNYILISPADLWHGVLKVTEGLRESLVMFIGPKNKENPLYKKNQIDRFEFTYDVELLHLDPTIQLVNGFMNPDECDEIVKLAEPHFSKSLITDEKTNQRIEDPLRTSYTMRLECWQNDLVTSIEKRAALFCGVHISHVEKIQVVRYLPGQYFGPHKDYYDYGSEAYNKMDGGQRKFSLFVFLNDLPDDEKGGNTRFTILDLETRPKKGCALKWDNCMPNGQEDVRTEHEGIKLEKSIKYGMNIWIRKNPISYRSKN